MCFQAFLRSVNHEVRQKTNLPILPDHRRPPVYADHLGAVDIYGAHGKVWSDRGKPLHVRTQSHTGPAIWTIELNDCALAGNESGVDVDRLSGLAFIHFHIIAALSAPGCLAGEVGNVV